MKGGFPRKQHLSDILRRSRCYPRERCVMLEKGDEMKRNSPNGGTAHAKPSDEKEYGTLENWAKPTGQEPKH